MPKQRYLHTTAAQIHLYRF